MPLITNPPFLRTSDKVRHDIFRLAEYASLARAFSYSAIVEKGCMHIYKLHTFMLCEERIATSTLLIWETFATTILYDYWNKTDECWRGFARVGLPG